MTYTYLIHLFALTCFFQVFAQSAKGTVDLNVPLTSLADLTLSFRRELPLDHPHVSTFYNDRGEVTGVVTSSRSQILEGRPFAPPFDQLNCRFVTFAPAKVNELPIGSRWSLTRPLRWWRRETRINERYMFTAAFSSESSAFDGSVSVHLECFKPVSAGHFVVQDILSIYESYVTVEFEREP